jgi:hypothetical protein
MLRSAQHDSAGREAEVYLNLLRIAEALSQDAERTLKPFGLTGTQYNVLRILSGAAGIMASRYLAREKRSAAQFHTPRLCAAHEPDCGIGTHHRDDSDGQERLRTRLMRRPRDIEIGHLPTDNPIRMLLVFGIHEPPKFPGLGCLLNSPKGLAWISGWHVCEGKIDFGVVKRILENEIHSYHE